VNITLADIVSIIAVLLAVGLTAWMKVLSNRAFKSTDVRVGAMERTCASLDTTQRAIEKELVRFEEMQKSYAEYKQSIDAQIKQLRQDFLRENQMVLNQLETIHGKIDHVDNKLDKMRNNRRS
jgi:hypothetical protein